MPDFLFTEALEFQEFVNGFSTIGFLWSVSLIWCITIGLIVLYIDRK